MTLQSYVFFLNLQHVFITLLKRGYSVRNVAKLASVSNSTVQRVKKEFAL